MAANRSVLEHASAYARRCGRWIARLPYVVDERLRARLRRLMDIDPPAVDRAIRPPLPPAHLRYRVAGHTDAAKFLAIGRACADRIDEMVLETLLPEPLGASVLDFGCGCGRVARHARARWSHIRLFGVDIQADMVRWCRRHLPGGSFQVCRPRPPLDFADDAFDLVYGFSVFTHLAPVRQGEWIRELGRVIRPGGSLILSLHGPARHDVLSDGERSALERGEIVVRSPAASGLNRCAAFHSRSAVTRLAGPLFTLEAVREAEPGDLLSQDVYRLDRTWPAD